MAVGGGEWAARCPDGPHAAVLPRLLHDQQCMTVRPAATSTTRYHFRHNASTTRGVTQCEPHRVRSALDPRRGQATGVWGAEAGSASRTPPGRRRCSLVRGGLPRRFTARVGVLLEKARHAAAGAGGPSGGGVAGERAGPFPSAPACGGAALLSVHPRKRHRPHTFTGKVWGRSTLRVGVYQDSKRLRLRRASTTAAAPPSSRTPPISAAFAAPEPVSGSCSLAPTP